VDKRIHPPEDQANPGADNARILGGGDTFRPVRNRCGSKGESWDRDQHGTATAAAAHMAQQAFAWIAGLLDQASYNERTGRALHVVLAELGQLCGWSAWDAGDYGLAQRYNVAGLRAAHSADDRPLGAHILASLAHQASRGQPAEAVTLIETAVAGTRGQATPALLAELHIRHAKALGTLRDTSGCTAAISQARTQVEQLKLADDPPWLYWMDCAAITVDAGECLRRLGQPDQAVAMLRPYAKTPAVQDFVERARDFMQGR
jgi:hypothetical protein